MTIIPYDKGKGNPENILPPSSATCVSPAVDNVSRQMINRPARPLVNGASAANGKNPAGWLSAAVEGRASGRGPQAQGEGKKRKGGGKKKEKARLIS